MTKPTAIAIMLFRSLEKSGIAYCHWKGNHTLVAALAGLKDIDLLVEKIKAIECEKILLRLGFKRVISQPWARFPGIEDWIGFDQETGNLIHVHLYYRILIGHRFTKEQHLPWEELILATAIKDPCFDVYIIDPNLDMLLLITRICFEVNYFIAAIGFNKGLLPRKYSEQLVFLLAQVEKKEIFHYAIKLFGQEVGEEVVRLIQIKKMNLSVILQLNVLIRKELAICKRYSSLTARVLQFYYYCYMGGSLLFTKVLGKQCMKKRFVTGGLVIAVVGCDGAGKSTIVKELQHWLSWKIDVARYYLGSEDGLVVLLKKIMVNVKLLPDRGDKETSKVKDDTNMRILKYLWKVYLARCRYRKVLNLKRDSYNGRTVLTDRYPQASFCGLFDGPSLTNGKEKYGIYNAMAKYEEKLYQKISLLPPDIVIKLHVPAEIAMERKPDHNKEMLWSKAKIIDQLPYEGAAVINIDTSLPCQEVIKEIKIRLWSAF